ncbi:MAG TPA: sigma-70 family RNA polymerase sigma factor [Planctomycetota bacterium]
MVYRDLPDRELVARCQLGEADAFNELVNRHQDRVYAAVTRFCGNGEDAADVVQRAFINAYRKISEFKGDAAFSTWIYRIAFNQAISFRRENRRPSISLHAKDEDGLIAEPVDDRAPGESMETEETRKKVQQALERLEEEDRQIIILKDLQGHSYDEIAAILEVPKGTVRSRLHRARMELKEKLKPILGTFNKETAS